MAQDNASNEREGFSKLENKRSSGNYGDNHDAREYGNPNEDDHVPQKSWIGNYMDDLTKEDPDLDYAPVLLPWRIGLFLLTSTISQNLCYLIPTYLSAVAYDPKYPKRGLQFYSLVYNMNLIGPVFGLIIDLVRVYRERFRPVIIIACIVNAIIGYVAFGSKTANHQYGSCLMLSWLLEVGVMFMYIPMNAVVINYGNSLVESPAETSARIGGLMAQAMVWRNTGTLIYTIFHEFAVGDSSKPYVDNRSMCLIAAIVSSVLVVQILLLTKRSYFTDFRKTSFKNAEQVRFFKNAVTMSKNTASRKVEAPGLKFMFILCFTFIYFMLPDPLYNTVWQFNAPKMKDFSLGLKHANAIVGSIGSVLGALGYALWMFFAQRVDASDGRLFRTNPFIITLAGCGAWAFGIFFHFFGQMGSNNPHFHWKVFIPFQSFVVSATLAFAFMPSLSLTAMQAPRFFEATAFQLYSVCTAGGGIVSGDVTSSFMGSLGASTTKGYWKALLLFIVFRFVPMVPAVSLPKFRDDETIPCSGEQNEPANEMEPENEKPYTQPARADKYDNREEQC